jgi:hypothetical protein
LAGVHDRQERQIAATRVRGSARLASEDIVVSAPMSYAGSAQRIMRLRRRANDRRELAAITTLAGTLVLIAWAVITVWYLTWGILLVPYRVTRRGARKRKVEALRHRELMEALDGSVAASAAAAVAAEVAAVGSVRRERHVDVSGQRVADVDRERTGLTLRDHMLAGRLTAEEFEERLGSTHQARTRGDLNAVTADLPPDTGMPQPR